MGSLSNQFISQSFISLIHLGNDSTISSSFVDLQDGLGNSLKVSVNAQGEISASGNIYAANLTGSTINSASLVTTSSFNQYTSSTNARLNSLETTSGSLITSASNSLYTASFSGNTLTFTKGNGSTFGIVIPDISGSIINTGSFVVSIQASAVPNTLIYNQGNGTTSSILLNISQTDISALNSFTASVAGTNTFTQSANARLTSIESTTASLNNSVSSLNTFSASALTTASVSSNTITFTKGNGSTFNIVVDTGSAITTDISSLNAFTASVAGTNTFTASIAGTNAFTQSAQQSINSLNAASSSWVTSAITASSLVTASANLNTITFNKGDGSTFAVTVNTGSSVATDISALNAFTASIAGTNAFTASIAGTNNFTASIKETNTFTASLAGTNAFTASIAGTNTFTASANSRLNSIEIFTASVAGTNAFTASAQNSLNSLNAATSSYITSAVTASMAVSSSQYAVTASLAREVIVSAQNANAQTLPIGTVVRIVGANGDNPQFNTASYDNEAQSLNTLGVLANTAAPGAYADVTVIGKLVGVDTDGMVAGDILYLGANGTFTNVQPQAPLQIVVIGEVLRVQQNNGSMFVNISNGWELNELHNVRVVSAQQGDLLVYEATSSLWKNQSSSSFAKTNQANTFNGNQIVSGSMTVTGNLSVFGSASFTTVTSSVFIGGNTIILNTFTPSVRFGGMSVIDSGSTGLTGSLLWDSEKDKWIYTNPSGSTYDSAMLISGPKNTSAPGNELGLVTNYIVKAVGEDHISSSQITDDGTTVTIPYTASIGNIVGLGAPLAFSSSIDSRINDISAAIPSLLPLNAFSASTNTFTASIAGTNAFTASTINSLNSINGFTASIAGTNAFTASASARLNSLENKSASVDNSISSINGFTASVAGTNAFTASTSLRLNSLEATSASVNNSISSINGFTSSALITASFSGNTLTFTKGDASTFGIILPDVSGSGAINTGSFATTGSNSFFGNQTISGSVGISGSAITFVSGALSGSVITNIGDTYTDVSPVNRIITLTSASYASLVSGGTTDPNTLYIVSGSTGVVDITPLNQFTASIAGTNAFTASIAGTNAFTASTVLRLNSIEAVTASLNAKTGSLASTGSNTFIGTQIMSGSVQGRVIAATITSNTASLDFSQGNFFTLALAATVGTHISASNVQPGETVSLRITQNATPGTVTYPPSMKFASGSAYVASTTANAVDVITFISYDNTTVLASSVKNLI